MTPTPAPDTRDILAGVNSPADLKRLDLPGLQRLAAQIRERIVETVAVTGGHLASSLGAVELTLALHYVFDTPRDKIVWDVGHQTYAHKIVTGRKDRFATLRRAGGLSGFPKREESPYDTFNVGHSGTSISAAVGFAEARRIKGEQFSVVAVIGDGSLTSGLALEGLNWAGYRKEGLIIILNDNEMSISPNVGALSAYLSRIMTGQTVRRLRSEIKSFLRAIPILGGPMESFCRALEEQLKAVFLPGALFEDLGYTYVGPIEGHRLDYLISTLDNCRNLEGPVLLHVVTRKGKGYRPAEAEPLRFHGTGPFDIATGRPLAGAESPPTYTRVFGEALVALARGNPRITAITAAMCNGTGLDPFAAAFPERFFDVGIAEGHGVTFAAGLAVEGQIPVVAIYSTFMQRAYDEVLHDVCLQKLPVVLALDRAGFVGDDGATHQGLFDLAFLRSIPNLIVMAPKDENELRGMLATAVDCGAPAALRYPRGRGVGVPLDGPPRALPVGQGEILREGTDLAIVAIGATVHPACEAADLLAAEGISVRVVNARFVKPLDEALLRDTARRFKNLLTVEENILDGGFGSAVLECLTDNGLAGNLQVRRLGIPDTFVEHASQQELRARFGIDRDGIVRAAREMTAR